MARLTFPINPEIDDLYVTPDNLVYIWSGVVWNIVSSSAGGGGVEEAPVDGNKYVRKDTDWETIDDSFTGLTDTPVDYTGQSGLGLAVNSTEDGLEFVGLISDAPSDTTNYVRSDNQWKQTPDQTVDDANVEAPVIGSSFFDSRSQKEFTYMKGVGYDYGYWVETSTVLRTTDEDELAWFPEFPNIDDVISFAGIDYQYNGLLWVKIHEDQILEAPEDGGQYARVDGGWSLVVAPDSENAPVDGQFYGKKLNTWSPSNMRNSEPTMPTGQSVGDVWHDEVTLKDYTWTSYAGNATWVESTSPVIHEAYDPDVDVDVWFPGSPVLNDIHVYKGVSYEWNGVSWEKELIQVIPEAPSDGSQYIRKDGAWSVVDLQGDSVTIQITDVSDLSDIIVGDAIVLQDGYNYIIDGEVDIGDKYFQVDVKTSLLGYSDYTSTLKSTHTGNALFKTAVGCSLTLNLLKIDTPDTELFDITNTGFTFIECFRLNIENTKRLGKISNVNRFLWTGDSFITTMHDVANGGLAVNGSCDIVKFTDCVYHRWNGWLFDVTGTIRDFTLKGNDYKVSNTGQRLFSNNTDNDSILGSIDGMGFVNDCLFRNDPDEPLSQVDFDSLVTSGVILGNVDWELSNWTLFGNTNIPQYLPIPEAPIDGSQYARIDGSWGALDAYTEEAPIDGNEYVRQDGSWEALSKLPEAPVDGSKYGRKDEAWEQLTDLPDAPVDGEVYVRKDGEWFQQNPVTFRASWKSDIVPDYQYCTTNDIPQAIIFSDVTVPDPSVSLITSSGVIEITKYIDSADIHISAQVIRQINGGSTLWGIAFQFWDGLDWLDVPDSTRYITFESSEADDVHHFNYSVSVKDLVVGTQFRFVQISDNVNKQIGLITNKPFANLPNSAGFILSLVGR